MPFVKMSVDYRWAEDGVNNVLLKAGEVVEVSVRCATVCVEEKFGKIVEAPGPPEEDEDDDETTAGEGDGSGDEGGESDDDSDGEGDESGDSGPGNGDSEGDEDVDDEEEVEVNSTPRAIEVAEELSVDMKTVAGTGDDGQVTVEDVRNAARAAKP